ncbi:MAG: glycosyltransferase [Breznakia sp.]
MQKRRYKIGFVVLHYQVIKETIACIESIITRIDSEHYRIVVVDNGSTNHSGKTLQQKYADNPKVKVFITGKNMGFSRGNNIGFEYAKKSLLCDFIVMTNNDTELMQDDFFTQIVKEYEKSHFALLGPEIHLMDDSICRYPFAILKLAQIEEDRKRVQTLLVKNKWFLESLDLFVKHTTMRLIRWNKIRKYFRADEKPPTRKEKVRLHGCCMVFSPEYIRRFDGLQERTFFYGEEDILFVQLIRHNLLSVYQPLVKIKHHEQAATKELMGKDYKKRRYVYEQHLKTLDILEGLYKEDIESLQDYIL